MHKALDSITSWYTKKEKPSHTCPNGLVLALALKVSQACFIRCWPQPATCPSSSPSIQAATSCLDNIFIQENGGLGFPSPNLENSIPLYPIHLTLIAGIHYHLSSILQELDKSLVKTNPSSVNYTNVFTEYNWFTIAKQAISPKLLAGETWNSYWCSVRTCYKFISCITKKILIKNN